MHRLPEIKTIYNRLKQSAKSRQIPFDLTLLELYDLSFPITCPILGMPLKFNRGTAQDDSFSIDRIDSTLGYCINNIHVISWRANRLKNDATLEELQKISNYLT